MTRYGKRITQTLGQVLITGRLQIPPKFEMMVKQYGKHIIKGLTIARTPISWVLSSVINTLLNVPYDKLFHLQLWVELDNNIVVVIEKNEVLNAHIKPIKTVNTELLEVDKSLVPNIAFGEFVNNTGHYMGDKFIQYSIINNCQQFIKACLVANGINEVEYIEFIEQDVKSILEGHTTLRKIANTTTQILDRGQLLIGRGDVKVNNWIKHVKVYAIKHNVSYKDALILAKPSYKK